MLIDLYYFCCYFCNESVLTWLGRFQDKQSHITVQFFFVFFRYVAN